MTNPAMTTSIFQPAERLAPIQEYYFSHKLREIEQLRQSGKSIINLGIGSPDLPPHPDVIVALQQSAEQSTHHGYQSYQGVPALRQAFADWYLRTYRVQLNPTNQLLPLAGSKEGILHISMAFLDTSAAVWIPNPGYPTYAAASRLAGATVLDYAPESPDLDVLAQQVTEHRHRHGVQAAALVWLNYPHMPTGLPASRGILQAWVDFARAHQVMLVHDNPYSLVLHPEPLSILEIEGAADVALELNSLSKSHQMAGWRMGVLAGRADAVATVLRYKSQMDSGMFLPLQHAAVKALQGNKEYHESLQDTYRKRRNVGMRLLSLLGATVQEPQAGMFLWARIPSIYANSDTLSDILLHQTGVFLTPGHVFGSRGDAFIRLSLCSSEAVLEEAYSRIQHWLSSSTSSNESL